MIYLLWTLVILLLIPALLVALECAVACLPASREELADSIRPNVAILIPAHNESAVVAGTLASIMPQLEPGDRILLVADNCSDDTAEIARSRGAEVVERYDDNLRGKGYALAFGMHALRQNPPEIMIIVDADCQLREGALDRLAKTARLLDAPVQALYLMFSENRDDVRQKIAEFAWVVKNHVRALGMLRLGMPCPLMGTGMAFPWHIISGMDLATGALVEDMLLGGELVARGHPPVFCPHACVTSHFPVSNQDAHTQRRRWEHGHIGMILNYSPKLLKMSLLRGNLKGVFFAMDMMVPPLALQSMFMLSGLGMAGLAAGFGPALPFQTMLAGFLLFAFSLFLAWLGHARHVIGVGDAVRIPAYMMSKISIYLTYLLSKEKSWVKTRRG